MDIQDARCGIALPVGLNLKVKGGIRTVMILIVAMALGLMGHAQVDLQTGAAEQTLPLIDYRDTRSGLGAQITLNYSSGNGLLINEIASDVGTGWNLEAGGLITRIQVGEPDDQPAYDNGVKRGLESLKRYPAGFLYNDNIGKGCNNGLNYHPFFKDNEFKENNNTGSVYKEKNIVAGDTEQDKFVFHINGRTGVFVIGKDNVVKMIGDSRVKITFTKSDMTSQGIRTTIDKFVLVTEDGLRYTFQQKSLTRLARYKLSKYQNGQWVTVSGNPSSDAYAVNRYAAYALGDDERPFIVSSWYLSTVENTNTGDQISYGYSSVASNVATGKYLSHQRDLNGSCGSGSSIQCGRNFYSMLLNPQNAWDYSWNSDLLNKLKPGAISITYGYSITQAWRISRINLRNEHIDFSYDPVARVDLDGESALTGISYYSINGVGVNKLIRKYKLNYGYFIKNAIRPYNSNFTAYESKIARLCLLSLQKVGSDGSTPEPAYNFSYYLGGSGQDNIVPPRNSLSQDHWGYYNGDVSGIPASEDADFLQNEKFYLKPVLPNYREVKPGYAANGLLRSVQLPTRGTIEYFYQQNLSPITLTPTANGTYAGGVAVSKTILHDGISVANDIITSYNYILSNGTSSHVGDEKPMNYEVSSFDLLFKSSSYKYAGIAYPELATSLDIGKSLGSALLNAAISAGLQTALTYLFSATVSNVVGLVIFIGSVVEMVIRLGKSAPEVQSFFLTNTNNISVNPLQKFYSRVEVKTNSPTGTRGKVVYEFTNQNDYPFLVPNLVWPYIQSQRMTTWVYGLPKRMLVYDNNGQLMEETDNNYTYYVAQAADASNTSCKCATRDYKGMKSSDWQGGNNEGFSLGQQQFMVPRTYSIYTGRTDLASSIKTTYNHGRFVDKTETKIITDPSTLLQRGTVIAHDVNSYTIRMTYYPNDYNLTGAIALLKQNNAIHTPVATETWQLKVNPSTLATDYTLIDATVTEYQIYNYGNQQTVRPWRVYTLKTKTPIPLSAIGFINPNSLIRQPQYFKVTDEYAYNVNSDMVQHTQDQDDITSNIYDQWGENIIATTKNAVSSDVAYTNFEDFELQGWNLPYMDFTTDGLGGNYGFEIGLDWYGFYSTAQKDNLDPSKHYIVSFWKKRNSGGPVYVNNATPNLLYSSPNGWDYYQIEVQQTSTVTVSGTDESANIDELRLFPKGSSMETYTYEKGVGMTARQDASGRMLFYEYDGIGQLRLVRDQDKNVIKTYEVNYKTQPGN